MQKIFVVFIIIFSVNLSAAEDQQTIRVGYLPAAQALPLFVMLEEKLTQNKNIRIEPVPFQSPNLIINALLSNNIDAAFAAATGITLIAEENNQGKFKFFGFSGADSNTNQLNETLIVKPDSIIKSWKDLEDKKLGVLPGIQWRTIANYLINLNQLNNIQLIELPLGMHSVSLAGGAVDAVLTLEPYGIYSVLDGIGKVIEENPAGKKISSPFLPGASVLAADFIKSNPELVKLFVQISDEATNRIKEDFDRYKKLLPKFIPIKEEYISNIRPAYFCNYSQISDKEISAVTKFAEIFVQQKILSKLPEVKNMLLKQNSGN